MKLVKDLSAVLASPARNEDAYTRYIVDKMLDQLGIPDDPAVRLRQFRVDNPFGDGDLKLDFLLVVDAEIPMVVIEAKRSAADFEKAREEAVNYARNFNPRESNVRKMTTVPFIIAAAGHRAEMYRATARGIEIIYEPIREGGVPAFLEWKELVEEAAPFKDAAGPSPPSASASRRAPAALEIELVKKFLDELYGAIYGKLQERDDARVRLLDEMVLAARDRDADAALRAATRAKLPAAASKRIRKTLQSYDAALSGGLLGGAGAAAAYRDFITRERSAGGLDLFTGESQSRPYRERGRIKYRQTARYFTPTEIIHEMVRLAAPAAGEKIIDPTCGSGGFLAEIVTVLSNGDARQAKATVKKSVVGIDDDPFCVDVAQTLLRLLVKDGEPRVHLHNCLYQDPPSDGEFDEDAEGTALLASGTYDLVIGNPPGNKRYSGTNERHVQEMWHERFGITKSLWDCAFFVKRALDLARPDGGRICLLLPDGFFANAKFQRLRRLVMAEARVLAIIAVPKVFRNTQAGMAILYAERTGTWNTDVRELSTWRSDDPVYLADLPEASGDKDVDGQQLPVELKATVDAYLARAGERGKAKPHGLRAFGAPEQFLDESEKESAED